ncbi:hypothetical protein N7474_003312 [Penicillium riverlandense]|uniref:uncharacterized protein n=1 Tax=Penicillium riverlandense TaxID=1903569 RepID=UPI002548CA9F|nr:uncharacterized protein N7474_003312 [Penicillium riverlandense]KAJ5826174.1 hypothetical protein N7474_003312 [Penicillium riverlandense]
MDRRFTGNGSDDQFSKQALWNPNMSFPGMNRDAEVEGELPRGNTSSFPQYNQFNPGSFGTYTTGQGNPGSQPAHYGNLPPPQPPNQSPIAFGAFSVPTWNPTHPGHNAVPTMPSFNPMLFSSMMGTPMNMNPFLMSPSQQVGSFQPMSTTAALTPEPSGPPTVKVPIPEQDYLAQASLPPQKCDSPRPLLVILDLNGTLIYRKARKFPPSFARRDGLDRFLELLLKKHTVVIWSSSQPQTVRAVCDKLFPGEKRKALAAEWGRDKFNLSRAQYNNKIQVYKKLEIVWGDLTIQLQYPREILGNETLPVDSYPTTKPPSAGNSSNKAHLTRSKMRGEQPKFISQFPVGQRWDQSNTVLIDDSKLKASKEPYNILEIPEFMNDPNIDESRLFAKVLGALDALSRHDDVSKVLRVWNEQILEDHGILELKAVKEDPSFWETEKFLEEEDEEDDDGGAALFNDSYGLPTTGSVDALSHQKPRNQERKKERKAVALEAGAEKTVDSAASQQKHQDKKAKKREKKRLKKAAAREAQASAAKAAHVTFPKRAEKVKKERTVMDAKESKRKMNADRIYDDWKKATLGGSEFVTASPQLSGRISSNTSQGQSPTASPLLAGRILPEKISRRQTRSLSPLSSSSESENELLDRLEESLGFTKSKSDNA